MKVESEILVLSDRVILNIITDQPFILLEEMQEWFKKNDNIFPLAGRSIMITEKYAVELNKEFFKTLFIVPKLTITISDGSTGAEFVTIQVTPEKVFELI